MVGIKRLSVVTAVGLSFSLLPTGDAFAFTFTKIADTSGSFTRLETPVINDSGTVAFSADLNTRSPSVFTGNGEALTNIVTFPPNPVVDSPFIPSGFSSVGVIDINNAGTILFERKDVDIPFQFTSFFTSSDGTLTPLGRVGGPRSPLFELYAINDNGSIASRRIESQFGIITSASVDVTNNGTHKGGVSLMDRFESSRVLFFENPDLNNSDTLVFGARLVNENTPDRPIFIDGLFTRTSDGIISPVATTNTDRYPFSSSVFSPASINDSGTVAFGVRPLDQFDNLISLQNDIIFTSNGGSSTTIADTSGPFKSFGNPAINNIGTVAFFGTLDTGGSGIFTGADPITNKVITLGDSLFGSKVVSLDFSTKGLNNSGQLAFLATFEDGTSGIFRANPESISEPKSVPEPASGLGLLLVGAFGVGSLLKGKQKRQPSASRVTTDLNLGQKSIAMP
jgi:hypothetical protein